MRRIAGLEHGGGVADARFDMEGLVAEGVALQLLGAERIAHQGPHAGGTVDVWAHRAEAVSNIGLAHGCS
jgi:hypothetical protein